MREEDYMIGSIYYSDTSSTSTGTGYWTKKPTPIKKKEITEMKDELIKIAEEMEEDREKHLPKFDPKDLDL